MPRNKDVMSRSTQFRHGFRVESLPASQATSVESRYGMVAGQRRQDAFEERLADNTRTPVPDQVVFRIDFPAWHQSQPDRTRRVIEAMAEGHRTEDIARRFGLSPGRISQMRAELHADWRRFQGDDPDAG